MAQKDPDDNVLAIFKDFAIKNEKKSAEAGRPIYDDIEVVELHYPGSKNWSTHPATALSHWSTDPLSGEQVKVTYAERFKRQYQQFKMKSVQTKSGTPIDHAPFLTEGRRAELKALNIYTVEQLASIDGQELKNLGPGGREMKQASVDYLEEADGRAVNTKAMAELEALRAKYAVLEDDLKSLKQAKEETPSSDDAFDGMSLEQLRDFITSHTGVAPKGALNRKTLVRMARDVAPEKANAA